MAAGADDWAGAALLEEARLFEALLSMPLLSVPLDDKVGEPLEASSDESDSSLLELADADSTLDTAADAAALDETSVMATEAELSSGIKEDTVLEGPIGGAVSDEAASDDVASTEVASDVATSDDVASIEVASDVATSDDAASDEAASDEMLATVDEAENCSGIEDILMTSTPDDVSVKVKAVERSLGTEAIEAPVEAEISGAALDAMPGPAEEATRPVLLGALAASDD